MIKVDSGGLDLGVALGLNGFEKQDRIALHQRDAGPGDNLANDAAALGADQVLHLHGFQHGHGFADTHPLTRLHTDAHHRALLR